LLLWRRYGYIAAVLCGPPARAHYWSHGTPHVDGDILADHVAELVVDAGWPPGNAPIVVTGTSDGDLADAREALEILSQAQVLPPGEAARLRPYSDSLSEWMATTEGWRAAVAHNVLAAPPCVLAGRVRGALHAAGLPVAGRLTARLDQPGPRGDVFRALW